MRFSGVASIAVLLILGGIGGLSASETRADSGSSPDASAAELFGSSTGVTAYLIEVLETPAAHTLLATYGSGGFGAPPESAAFLFAPVERFRGQWDPTWDPAPPGDWGYSSTLFGGHQYVSARSGDHSEHISLASADDDHKRFLGGADREFTGDPGLYVALFATTTEVWFDFSLENARVVEGPIELGGFQRIRAAEHDGVGTEYHVAAQTLVGGLSATGQTEIDFETGNLSLVVTQVLTGHQEQQFSYVDPSGRDIAFNSTYRMTGGVFLPGLMVGTSSELHKSDLLSPKEGTWSLRADATVGPRSDLFVVVYDLAPLWIWL